MNSKFIAPLTAGLMIIPQVSYSQSWERDESNDQVSVTTKGSNDVAFSFQCNEVDGKPVAMITAYPEYTEELQQLEIGSSVRGYFDIDGNRTNLTLSYDSEGDFAALYSIGNPDFDTETGSLDQVNIVYELQNGRSATFSVPLLKLSSIINLTGSMDALRGVFLGCGMRLTGTSPWED